jgi:hypothetical protein
MTVAGTSTIYVGGGNLSLGTQATMTVAGTSTIHVKKTAANNGNVSVGTQGKINLYPDSGALSGTTTPAALYMNFDHSNSALTKSGNITILTQGDLNVGKAADPTHPVQATIYVDGGDMNVSTQGDVNNTGKPKNLSVYSSGLNINFNTQTDFYGSIYAPNAAVALTPTTSQGEIFGSITSKTLTAGTQAGIHFDLALVNVPNAWDYLPGISSWQETKP